MKTAPRPTSAPTAPLKKPDLHRVLGQARFGLLVLLIVLLGGSLGYAWWTRDAMEQLSFLRGKGQASTTQDAQKTLVDLRPWLTAQALAPLAVTGEELVYARQAEHLADHEVDQAFAAALRQATARLQKRTLTGEALALQQKVTELEQLVKEDESQVKALGGSAKEAAVPAEGESGNDDLEIAQAQLSLDSDQLNDAQQDLARASGDDRAQIQSELQEHESAMKKYDSQARGDNPMAVASARSYRNLAARIGVWNAQRSRSKLLQEAIAQAEEDLRTLTAEHNRLEAQTEAMMAAAKTDEKMKQDKAAHMANLHERSAERQLLSIYDDRIQTQQRLAEVYRKWLAQVALQHRIVLHLILQSVALIALILICVLLGDAWLQRLTVGPVSDRRRLHTLRTILQLGLQLVGAALTLLVIFGAPKQISTVLGLATAGFTVVMQDFILAFFGWFVLMGKNGIRVGDWVEINGVGGEVTEVGLFRTTMLETGNWTDKGHPTGRRVTFINSFAIRGQFFNFSTTGQWMWDEISVTMPAGLDSIAMAETIREAVLADTAKDAEVAEQEWKRGTRHDGLSQFTAEPTVNLRPSGAGIEVLVRYVTRAAERFERRNQLCQRVLDVLHKPEAVEGS